MIAVAGAGIYTSVRNWRSLQTKRLILIINMKRTICIVIIFACVPICGCNMCFSVKETKLGKNFRLSEYDEVDRRILYSEEDCAVSGIEIVPMTVVEFAYDSRWLIAKSKPSRYSHDSQFWIVDKVVGHEALRKGHYQVDSLKSFIVGPLDTMMFVRKLNAINVSLKLRKI